jgi:hypothetical protein
MPIELETESGIAIMTLGHCALDLISPRNFYPRYSAATSAPNRLTPTKISLASMLRSIPPIRNHLGAWVGFTDTLAC